jgi:hypothetical protein
MTRGTKKPRGRGAGTTRDTNKQASKSEEKQDPTKTPSTHRYSKIASNNLEEPPEIDSTAGLIIESPSPKSPRNQDHPIEGSESEGHSNPIKEPENSVASEESLWGERLLNMEEEMETPKQKEPITFEFPIKETEGILQMKNIPPSALPNFRGLPSEDPDTFLFEFDVLCRSYDYYSDAHKLKLFPATLKEAALRWFMGLGGNSIKTWDEMKQRFLQKYQDYCKVRDIREEIFRMTQKEEETLEDYVERFQYNLQRTKQNTLDPETLRIIFLRGIKDDCMDALNLMGAGDISQMTYNDICELCKRYSRGITKSGKSPRDLVSRVTKPSGGGVTRTEIGNMLDNFKTDILSSFSSQLDTFQAKKKKEEADLALARLLF